MYQIIRRGKVKSRTAECGCGTIFIYDPGDTFYHEFIVCSSKENTRELRTAVKCPVCGTPIIVEEKENEKS